MLAKLKREITKISSQKTVQFADALQLGAKTDTDRAQTDTMNIQDAKAAVDKEWEKLQKLPEWQVMKVKSRKEVFSKGTKRGKDSSFCYADGLVPPQELEVGATVPNTQRTHCIPR